MCPEGDGSLLEITRRGERSTVEPRNENDAGKPLA
jgi:hypothetical protein